MDLYDLVYGLKTRFKAPGMNYNPQSGQNLNQKVISYFSNNHAMVASGGTSSPADQYGSIQNPLLVRTLMTAFSQH